MTTNDPSSYPVVRAVDVPWISADDMIEIDRFLVDDLHIGLLQMMENAGRNLARLVLDMTSPRRVLVAAGGGGLGSACPFSVRRPTTMPRSTFSSTP